MAALPEVWIDPASTDTACRASALIGKIAASKPLASPVTEGASRLALELDPTNADAHNTLGRIALSRKEWAEAEEHFLEACEAGAEIHSYVNASIAADMDGDLDWSETMARIATVAEPENPMPWLQVYGICCQRGDWKEAAAVIDEALTHSPESHELLFARAELRLHAGDAGGWFDYESRPTRLHLVSHLDEYPEWRGEPLKGKTLLVMREQGFGDEIMFARYLGILGSMAAKVIVFTYPDLARLIKAVAGDAEVITSESDIPDFDLWVSSGSLPLCCRGGQFTPLAYPLFKPSGNGLAASRITSPRLRVGLRWAGNARHARDRFRSFNFDVLRPLLETPGCDFYSLQDGEPAAQSDLPNIPAYCHDVADLAEAINALDVVITCDTMVGHLAGSLGKKTFVLLDKWPDWRWRLQPYASVKPLFNRDRWIDTLRQELSFEAANVAGHAYVEAPPKIGEANTAYGKMRHLNNDKYIGRSLALYGEYSPGEHTILRAILNPGDVVVEAGANIGALSGVIAEAIDPGGYLYAFEPQKEYFECLSFNLRDLPQDTALSRNLRRPWR